MSKPQRVMAIVNPSSGHGAGRRIMPQLQTALRRQFGNGISIGFSRDAAHLRESAQRAADEGYDLFIVSGGDGSVHFAIQPLIHSKTALGIIPVGSGNDLAVNLGIPSGFEEAVKVLSEGSIRSIDVGQSQGGVFACIAGVGFDSEVTRRANTRTRWIRGRALYPYAILRTLFSFRPRHVKIRCGERTFEGDIMFAVVANASSYGRGIRIAPSAVLDDGLFEVCVVTKMSKPRLLWNYPKTYRGTHTHIPYFLTFRGTTVDISADQPLDLYGDGEYIEQVPTRIRMLPRALKVVVPGRSASGSDTQS